jgi:hypothetical protein
MLSASKSQIHTHAFNESDEMFSLSGGMCVCVYFISHAGEPFLLFVFSGYGALSVWASERAQAGRQGALAAVIYYVCARTLS